MSSRYSHNPREEVNEMTDEHYVDPSSGAASQPGSSFPRVEGQPVPAAYDDDAQLNVSPVYATATALSPEENEVPDDDLKSLPAPDAPTQEASGADEGVDEGESSDAGEDDEFNPSDHNVDEVNQYLQDHPEDRDRVLEAEKNGKNRSTVG